MNWRCDFQDYGLNVNGVREVYIRMSFVLHRIVRFIIDGLKLRRISLLKSLSSNDSTWNGNTPSAYQRGDRDWMDSFGLLLMHGGYCSILSKLFNIHLILPFHIHLILHLDTTRQRHLVSSLIYLSYRDFVVVVIRGSVIRRKRVRCESPFWRSISQDLALTNNDPSDVQNQPNT